MRRRVVRVELPEVDDDEYNEMVNTLDELVEELKQAVDNYVATHPDCSLTALEVCKLVALDGVMG